MTQKPRYQQEHLVTAKLIAQSTGWMGISQFLGSFACYFICMNDFGFDIRQLWQKSNIPIILPLTSDAYNPSDIYFGNSNLAKLTSCAEFDQNTTGLDWINSSHPWADLRMSAVVCKENADGSVYFQHNMVFAACQVQQISFFTHRPICYTTQATKYGQTSYMAANVVGQVFNLFICKTRRDSVFNSRFDNKLIYIGIAIEYLLIISLTETSFMMTLISTRDIALVHYGIAAIPIGIIQFFLEEVRKYLIRNKICKSRPEED